MTIRGVDIEGFSKLLQKEIQEGNNWLVCSPNIRDLIPANFLFYKNEEDAANFCLLNKYRYEGINWSNCERILQAVQPFVDLHRERTNIGCYEIDETNFSVEYRLRTDPNLSPFYKAEKIPPYLGPDEQPGLSKIDPSENFGSLIQQLDRQGYDTEHFLHLETAMILGKVEFVERSFHYLESETIIYDHHFSKNPEGNYTMDAITGRLYYEMEIELTVINGISTAELEREMLRVDWDNEGYHFIKDNELVFQQLCKDPDGRLISVLLFNNNVPPWYDKPEFILLAEEELKVYPKMEFPGHIDADNLYETLKTYREVTTAIRQYSIDEAKEAAGKALLVEKLVKGHSCPLVAPSGFRQSDEVRISWDSTAKVFSFFFSGELKIDARKYFDRTLTEDYQTTLNELSQYPIRQLEDNSSCQNTILDILDGRRKPIHFERTILPADHIDKYVVVERSFMDINMSYISPADHFCDNDPSIAKSELNRLVEHFNQDKTKANSILMLVGQFKGKELQYEPDGIPTMNSGFRISSAFNFSPKGCTFSSSRNLNLECKIVEQMYVQRDAEEKRLIFFNTHEQTIDIDKGFWNRRENLPLEKNHTIEGGDLLVKLRTGFDKGRTI